MHVAIFPLRKIFGVYIVTKFSAVLLVWRSLEKSEAHAPHGCRFYMVIKHALGLWGNRGWR